MVYIGIDLHRKRSQVAALDGNGGLLFNRRVATRPDELFKAIGDAGEEPVEVVFEATFGWGWLADMLAEAGIPTHMAHPLATKAISSARVKNDSVDAKTLAHLLRTNLLPEAWLAPPPAREARRLVRMRAGLVRIRTKLKNQIHAVLGEHGVEVEMTDLFGAAGRRLLSELRLPAVSQQRLEACLRVIEELTDEVAVADEQLKALFGQDHRLERLLPIPGIGITIAATIVAEVWDVSRFQSPDHLCSWAGLTPNEHSSADHVRRGHISKQGSRWLRWVMVEAAIHALRDPELRDFFVRIARRRGNKIARVAVARRLLTLAFYALRSENGCRSYPVNPTSTTANRSRVPEPPDSPFFNALLGSDAFVHKFSWSIRRRQLSALAGSDCDPRMRTGFGGGRANEVFKSASAFSLPRSTVDGRVDALHRRPQ